MRALLAAVALAAGLSSAPSAWAGEGTMWGGELPGATALHLEGGFPWVEAGYRIPLGDTFEVMPFFRFNYFHYTAAYVTLTLGAEGRLQLVDADKLHGALTFALPLQLLFNGGTGFAIGLGYPGWAMDYALQDDLRLVFGIRFEDDLYFNNTGAFFVPTLPLFFGVEFQVGALTMGAKVEGGPAFFGALASYDLRGLFGVDLPF